MQTWCHARADAVRRELLEERQTGRRIHRTRLELAAFFFHQIGQ
jgi:hypothetical protein